LISDELTSVARDQANPLRDTQVLVGGQQRRLLDEVDVITSVSGGSYTAAYYGLFGDRTAMPTLPPGRDR
jgi:hypothetical protein